MLAQKSKSQMWTEKYRPKSLEELVDQDHVKNGLKSLLATPSEMPHLLLAGPPGTGKTTAALCVARSLFGEQWADYTLELNASDERGIDMVREKVKTFARHLAFEVPFKIVILDEADEMTAEAQTALRRIMEEYSNICRFILVCNYSSRIIEPIQSRCAVFRFTRLSEKHVASYLAKICEEEKEKFNKEALKDIYAATGGDLRHAVNLLQATALLGEITPENVRHAAGISGKPRVREVLALALRGDFPKAREALIELTKVHGLSEFDFIKYANEELFTLPVSDHSKAAELLAKYDARLVGGAHPDIQLAALLAELGALGARATDGGGPGSDSSADRPKQGKGPKRREEGRKGIADFLEG